MENSSTYDCRTIENEQNKPLIKDYTCGVRYIGKWEKGIKIGEGILENNSMKIKVKIKQGQIHRCIQVLENRSHHNNPISKFFLPDIKIDLKNSKEEYLGISSTYFAFDMLNILFYGRPYSFVSIYQIFPIYSLYDSKIYCGQLEKFLAFRSIKNIKTIDYEITGQYTNLYPNGKLKILIYEFCVKGEIKGFYCNGPFTLKNNLFKIKCNIELNVVKYPLRIISVPFNIDFYYENFKSFDKIVSTIDYSVLNTFHSQLFIFLAKLNVYVLKIVNSITDYNILSRLVTSSLVVEKNWLIFENKVSQRKNILSFISEKKKSETVIKKDEKHMISLNKNERYEGKIANGNFEGFGKYFYADGSIYVGEFKKNLRNGLGTFKFNDGKLYRGYWVNGLMHGKGYILNGNLKVFGLWEKNRPIKNSSNIILELSR